MAIGDILQKIFLLTTTVDRLEAKVKSLDQKILDHHERIVRLENSSDLTAEKAKNAAMQGAHAITMELMKEIYALKAIAGDALASSSPTIGLGDGDSAKRSRK